MSNTIAAGAGARSKGVITSGPVQKSATAGPVKVVDMLDGRNGESF